MTEKLWRVEVQYLEDGGDVINEVNYVKAETEAEVLDQYEWCSTLFVTQAGEAEVEAFDSGYIEGWEGHEDYQLVRERMDAYDGTGHQVLGFDEEFQIVSREIFTCGLCRGTFNDISLISGKKVPVEGYKTMWNVCQSCSDIVDLEN